ncbi:hypothetical protein A2U01_0053036, partial [Trifolium medium]|nr:hypothetical protein [Trifolium medium]
VDLRRAQLVRGLFLVAAPRAVLCCAARNIAVCGLT